MDEPSLIPRSCVYETLDRDGRTIIKHIDIEAVRKTPSLFSLVNLHICLRQPGISFDDVEVSVIKREWLSCLVSRLSLWSDKLHF